MVASHVMTEGPIPTEMSGGDDYDHKGHHDENCPDIQLPDDNEGTCVLDDHCSKVTCTSPPDSTGPFSHMVLSIQAYGCDHQPVKAKVSLESSSVKWSHTFKDGEKTAMPDNMKPPDVPVDMKIFLELELKKNGGKVHFKLLLLFESELETYNVTFLEGDLHACKCGSWFSRQSTGVRATVIIIPLLVVILLVSILALICYKKRQEGKRFLVDIFPSKDKIGMQRLSNEL